MGRSKPGEMTGYRRDTSLVGHKGRLNTTNLPKMSRKLKGNCETSLPADV